MGDNKKRTQKISCLNCSTLFSRAPSAKGKYCNTSCASNHRLQVNHSFRLKLFYAGKLKRRKELRKVLLEKQGRHCKICKRKTWLKKPIVLWLDHKDGNAKNAKPKNVRLICLNCDAQQPTFGAKNMGYGRKSRGIHSDH